ncbi:MAG TPA: methionyl-tRNA formyltransferase [Thermodesulfobacteriota bacterium]|nr:methionyl-tRNA formyltransferase [Thermodesulfobacteriota bacterium]
MRIVVVGQGPFGEKVLEALLKKGEGVVGTFSPPDKRGEGMSVLAEKSGIPFFRPSLMKEPQAYDSYSKLKPELAILAFVTDIIPEKLLAAPSLGTICYHPSILPRHRGASAINWALIQGDTRTGLTVFWVDKGIDTGPILLQKEVEIRPQDTTGSLYFNKLFPMGVDAMVEAVELIKKGKAPRIPQDDSKATYEPPCDDRVASVSFEKSIKDIYNLIRGCDPQPGAYTTYQGRRVRFYDARISSLAIEKQPGEIVAIEKESVQVAVRGGVIQIGKLRVDKGEKVEPAEFAKSTGAAVGDRLGNK